MKKNSMILILVAFLTLLSCEKDSLDENQNFEQDETAMNDDLSKYVEDDYKYNYQGMTYDEKTWESVNDTMDEENLIYIGVNDIIYVFNNKVEAENFEKKQFDEANNFSTLATSCNSSGQFPIKFRFQFYPNNNYSGTPLTIYKDIKVSRSSSQFLSNNKFSGNIPSSFVGKISSYRVNFLQTSSYRTYSAGLGGGYSCVKFKMEYKVYVEKLENLNFIESLNYKITRILGEGPTSNNTYSSYFNNLSTVKLMPAFPLTQNNSWNDKIKSWRVKIY